MKAKSIILLFALFSMQTAFAQRGDSLNTYEEYVTQLNSGSRDIDYQDFRISYLYSEAFKSKLKSEYSEQKEVVYKYIKKRKFEKIIAVCNRMLEVDYTSMFAHKYLQQTYKYLGDSLLYHKHHDIEFGLLRSIVKNGDGKSCGTAWTVTQLEEEYFILRMISAQLLKQTLEGSCDKMEVKKKSGKATYWFNVYWVFKGRDNLKN